MSVRNSVSKADALADPSLIMAASIPSREKEAISVVLGPWLRGMLPQARWL